MIRFVMIALALGFCGTTYGAGDMVAIGVLEETSEILVVVRDSSGGLVAESCGQDVSEHCLLPVASDVPVWILAHKAAHDSATLMLPLVGAVGAVGAAGTGAGLTAGLGLWHPLILAVAVVGIYAMEWPLFPDSDPEEYYRLIGGVGVPDFDEIPLSRDEKYAEIVKTLREKRKSEAHNAEESGAGQEQVQEVE